MSVQTTQALLRAAVLQQTCSSTDAPQHTSCSWKAVQQEVEQAVVTWHRGWGEDAKTLASQLDQDARHLQASCSSVCCTSYGCCCQDLQGCRRSDPLVCVDV